MYQPYPTSEQPPEPQRAEQPPQVRKAIKLMYVGAALNLIAILISLLTIGSLKSAILSRDPNFTHTQVNAAEGVAIAAAVIGGLIAVGLWLWMAWANGRGRSWARVLSAVFFGINTVDLLASIVRAHAVVPLIVGIIVWLVGFGAIVLIFSKESAPFYARQSAQA